jgi:hypothetical protein
MACHGNHIAVGIMTVGIMAVVITAVGITTVGIMAVEITMVEIRAVGIMTPPPTAHYIRQCASRIESTGRQHN